VSAADQIAVSAISLVEIAYLEEKSRLPAGLLARVITSVATPNAVMTEVPVDVSVVKAMIRVPRDTIPDMPDRIIAATALHLGVPLISRDAKIPRVEHYDDLVIGPISKAGETSRFL